MKGDDILGTVTLTSEQFANGIAGEVKLDTGGRHNNAYITLMLQPPKGALVMTYPRHGPGGSVATQQGVMMPGMGVAPHRGPQQFPGTQIIGQPGAIGTMGPGQVLQEPLAVPGTQYMGGGHQMAGPSPGTGVMAPRGSYGRTPAGQPGGVMVGR